VIEGRPEERGITVGERVDGAEQGRDVAPERDLDPFDAVVDQGAQLAVELVQTDHVVERRVASETVTTRLGRVGSSCR
jgi:hypothetical protein